MNNAPNAADSGLTVTQLGFQPPTPRRWFGWGQPISAPWLLRDLSFSLPSHGITVLLGPNGAGKSLLLRLAFGLLTPTCGQVRWHGQMPRDFARHLGFVLQKPVLLRRSVAANLRYALAVNRVPRREHAHRLAAALDFAQLAPLAASPARQLSGGEQQRLALARAWMLRPRCLLLDEPSNHLDPGAVAALEALLHRIRAAGTGVLLATHDLHQARRLADRVVFLHQGQLGECTPAAEFFHQPNTAAARAFLRGELTVSLPASASIPSTPLEYSCP